MPHFVAKSLAIPSFPFESEGYEFAYLASGSLESLVCVKTDNKRFFLSIKKRPHDYLVSFDKLTRISPIGYIKKALELFSQVSQAEITHSNLSNISMRQKQKSDLLKEPAFFLEAFHPEQEIWVEVGFGSGRHLLHQAEQNPDKLFIGIEIHKPSIEQVVRLIELKAIKNIYIAAFDARLLCEILPANSVGKIFVHFPVPWDKKPNRRIISETFIQESTIILKPGGTLELRTDSDKYFHYSFQTFMKMNAICLEVHKNRDLAVSSKYEDRWKRMEKDIYDVIMTNDVQSPQKHLQYDFSMDGAPFHRIAECFKNQTFKEDGYFMHLEKLYRICDDTGIICLTLGDYVKPEHKYVYISKDRSVFFPDNPLPTPSNIAAHRHLKRWINEHQ